MISSGLKQVSWVLRRVGKRKGNERGEAYNAELQRDPDAHAHSGDGEGVSKELHSGVHPDCGGVGAEAHDYGAQGKEEEEGKAHYGAVRRSHVDGLLERCIVCLFRCLLFGRS